MSDFLIVFFLIIRILINSEKSFEKKTPFEIITSTLFKIRFIGDCQNAKRILLTLYFESEEMVFRGGKLEWIL